MARRDGSITVYSDYVCPFCYLGRRSLQTYQATREDPLPVDWRPFDLRAHKRGPDGEIDDAVEDGKDDAYFEQVRRNVDRLRGEYAAEEMLGLDDLPDAVDSFDAQVASWYVADEHPGDWLAFDEAIFEALWVDGRDIGDVDVLAAIAGDVGLAPDEVRTAVGDAAVRRRLRERFDEARRDGVTGVPTFVHGGYVARGAVPPETLGRLVEGP